jgi:glyoxylase-like metal-dependent hydrolase (beta-lactamase superfamily II)
MGYPVIAHDNVRVRMAHGIRGGAPSPAAALPTLTFSDELDLYVNQDVRLIKVPAAHTDGDVFVHFAEADVLHLGDVFRTTGYPVIDVDNGGTAAGTLEALQVAMDLAGPDTRIIPGHGDLSAVDDVREFRDMISVVARRVSDLIDQGMTLEQVLAAAPTADLDERWGGSPERFLTGLYQSLAAAGD